MEIEQAGAQPTPEIEQFVPSERKCMQCNPDLDGLKKTTILQPQAARILIQAFSCVKYNKGGELGRKAVNSFTETLSTVASMELLNYFEDEDDPKQQLLFHNVWLIAHEIITTTMASFDAKGVSVKQARNGASIFAIKKLPELVLNIAGGENEVTVIEEIRQALPKAGIIESIINGSEILERQGFPPISDEELEYIHKILMAQGTQAIAGHYNKEDLGYYNEVTDEALNIRNLGETTERELLIQLISGWAGNLAWMASNVASAMRSPEEINRINPFKRNNTGDYYRVSATALTAGFNQALKNEKYSVLANLLNKKKKTKDLLKQISLNSLNSLRELFKYSYTGGQLEELKAIARIRMGWELDKDTNEIQANYGKEFPLK